MHEDGKLKILVIDDEPQIIKFLRIALQSEGYDVLQSLTGKEGLEHIALHNPDLIVLDLGLPDMDGLQVLQNLREWSQTPVLVLSVRSRDTDKVTLLDQGANDYVTKPFSIQEFMARIRVLLRNLATGDNQSLTIFKNDQLTVDFVKRRVFVGEEPVHLSKKEYALLVLLARNADRVVTQQVILKEIWGPARQDDTQYLRILVARLRQKLHDDPSKPRVIQTEQGVGYRLLSS
ncbi:MAG: response regulator transcription factor [Gammaproteobacteria bacterium]|nr:response regulator transcription factor [Gammaproteobacteria bacterium]